MEECEACNFIKILKVMGFFHVSYIVQMVTNSTKHHIWSGICPLGY